MAKSYGKGAVVITGIRDIDRRLKTLPGRVQKKVVRQAMRTGVKVIAVAVEAEAPVDTGAMKAAVKVRAVRSRKRGSIAIEARIGADERLKRTSGKTGRTVFYPAVVEYGDKDHPANPFMRRAYESAGEPARQVTIQRIRSGVEREASQG